MQDFDLEALSREGDHSQMVKAPSLESGCKSKDCISLPDPTAVFRLKRTISPTLNKQLEKTFAKKEELLRVLDRPQTPLHNNGTETDAREMVVKRKVSGGTRSEEGRKCRDTFVSLKKTCGKLGIPFLSYLKDRINGKFEVPWLADIIFARSSKCANWT